MKIYGVDVMQWCLIWGLKYWNEPVALLFDISRIPDGFLYDGKGRIVGRILSCESLYKKIDKILR